MGKILKDRMLVEDKISDLKAKSGKPLFWAKTKIIGGYGLKTNELGLSELDEVVFEKDNLVPIGGVQFVMEMLFGVKGSLEIPSLNTVANIGAQSTTIVPSNDMPYPYGQKVCLFGIGTGGASENNLTALEVKYHESEISDMIPFRYTNEELSETDRDKYFGKKIVEDTTAYYLKRFDKNPDIRHFFKNGEEGEDGSEVDNSFFNTGSETGVESFTEACLTVSRKDVREWFESFGEIEVPRVNSIALFSAIYDPNAKDYANIQLFSKLNIPTETLSLVKDMNIIYRVYGV